MQKLIPTIYFYLVSLIGFVLLIIGIFASIHYVVNTTQFPKYPLGYDATQRCAPIQLMPVKAPAGVVQPAQIPTSYESCVAQVEQERKQLQIQDLEKAISFTLIGLLVFTTHFFYARRKLQ